MAEKRRLQTEIERTLKKVHDGRMSFKETLEKFESSTNHAQKEKHEADLKKEIKKLQRFRDNIKTWLASPEVKDKMQLTDMRKLIESDMERFKVIEKETKTKAYSKEGLYIETKKDPMQKEKEDHLEWLKVQISKLSKNIEVCDFDITKLMPVNAKKKRNAEKDKVNDLNQKLGMFKSHLSKQETLMRLLDNDKIELDKVKDFRYTFEDFINNTEADLYKSDQGLFIYDELNLDELSADISMAADLDSSTSKLEIPGSSAVTPVSSGDSSIIYIVNPTSYYDKKEAIITETVSEVISANNDDSITLTPKFSIDKPKDKPQKLIKLTTPVSMVIGQSPKSNIESTLLMNSDINGKSMKTTVTSTPIKASSVATLDGSEYLSVHNISDSSIKEPSSSSLEIMMAATTISAPPSSLVASCQQVITTNTPPQLETVSNIIEPQLSSSSSIMKENYVVTDHATVGVVDGFSIHGQAAGNYLTTFSANHEPVITKSVLIKPSKIEPVSQSVSAGSLVPHMLQDMIGVPPTSQQQSSSYFDLTANNFMMTPSQNESININHQYVHRPSMNNMIVDHPGIGSLLPTPNNNSPMNNKDNTIDMILEPGDAMSPFRNHTFQNNDYYNNQISAMDHGRMKLPHTSDSEKARLIIYKNETQIPDYFPKDPIPGSDTEDYYMRLDSDTLFFIFYYFEGTKAQYLAAKALKRMSWRFHTGHMCWFQRHEEPKQITDNSESGTYIFYDFESMSRQKKENFTFSYNYLEDKDF